MIDQNIVPETFTRITSIQALRSKCYVYTIPYDSSQKTFCITLTIDQKHMFLLLVSTRVLFVYPCMVSRLEGFVIILPLHYFNNKVAIHKRPFVLWRNCR